MTSVGGRKQTSDDGLQKLDKSPPDAWPITGKPAAPASPAIPARRPVPEGRSKNNSTSSSWKISKIAKSQHASERNDSGDNIFDISEFESFEEGEPEVEVELLEVPSKPKHTKKRLDTENKRGNARELKVASDKSSESKKPTRTGQPSLPLVIGGVVAGLAAMIALGIFTAPALMATIRDLQTIKVPKEFEKFANNDLNFRCDVPVNWDVEVRGGSGSVPPSVKIERGRIKITYRASPSGAAIQDIAQAGAAGADDIADELKPVARVHEYQREKIKHENPDYRELGKGERIDTGWGEGRISAFVGTVAFDGRSFGYRVTLLTTNYQWNVICRCPTKREFEAFQPIFRQIIESTGR